mmetsp:Transcript_8719/g.13172  ORF Transcript_8719/g.13172 Transcript_8719/m.13172 type:complete len:90 (-) Transcript_8719:205-474(-)
MFGCKLGIINPSFAISVPQACSLFHSFPHPFSACVVLVDFAMVICWSLTNSFSHHLIPAGLYALTIAHAIRQFCSPVLLLVTNIVVQTQ